MNYVLISFLAFLSLSAFAHPGDRESMANLGKGTKLNVLKDINVSPNKRDVALGGTCYLRATQAKDYDRVVVGETSLVITATLNFPPYEMLYVNNANIQYIFCESEKSNNYDISIGLFKEYIKEFIEVQLADPTRM